MLYKTHLAITLFFILVFLTSIYGNINRVVFIVVALVATFLPDIDNAYSEVGRFKIFRFLQFFVRHRGMIHSLSFAFFLALVFAFFLPTFAFPFFLGYSIHLLADSLTQEGIKPFWPVNGIVRGIVRTGSSFEFGIFLVFIVLDIFVLVVKYF